MNEFDVEICKQNAIDATSIYSTAIINPGLYPMKTTELGSGTFVMIDGKRGILTNYHVLQLFSDKKLSCIGVPAKETGKLHILYFTYAIIHPINNSSSSENIIDVDMAFIVLNQDSCDIVINDLKQQFWDLNKSILDTDETNYKKEQSVWLIHGNVAEGKDPNNNIKTIFYKKAGPYIVVPDLDNIEYKIYYFQGRYTIIDNIKCPIQTINQMPSKFDGMSGAALWQITFDLNGNMKKIFIGGIATSYSPAKKAEYLICRGLFSLYGCFLPYAQALKMIIKNKCLLQEQERS